MMTPTHSNYKKPLPLITEDNQLYWQAAKDHELKLPRCRQCSSWVYPIAPICQNCWSEDLEWSKLSGRGNISSWVVFHRAFDPSFADDVPYLVVQVDMEEGMRFISNVVDISIDEIAAGMPVEATFDDVTSDITIVKFKRRYAEAKQYK